MTNNPACGVWRSKKKDAGVWHFCNQCGSQLFWVNAAGTELAIFVGTLDEPSVFRPEELKWQIRSTHPGS